MRNIVLVGFMGTGKTSVGKALAAELGMLFVDMDNMIEKRQGRSITDIFAREGEVFFRKLERTLVKELAAAEGLVIGTGGGIVLNPDNIADFERNSLVVCLTAEPETILSRVEHETHRPLLATDDKLGRIRELLDKRLPLYAAFAHQVDTNGKTLPEVVDQILSLYQ